MWKKSFIYFSALLFLLDCSASKESFTEQDVYLKKISVEKYGTNFRIAYNAEKTFALAVKQEKITAKKPNPLLQFFVFDMREKKIVFEDNLIGGKINWKTDNLVEVIVTPEIISTKEENKIHGYIYDVKLKTKKNIDSSAQNSNR